MTTTAKDWRPKGACYNTPHLTYIFFDSQNGYKQARPVCESCPVRAECLAAAVKEEAEETGQTRTLYGFRGGLTPKERRPMVAEFLRSMKRMARVPGKAASCHPEKNAYRRGLCQRCYMDELAEEHANV